MQLHLIAWDGCELQGGPGLRLAPAGHNSRVVVNTPGRYRVALTYLPVLFSGKQIKVFSAGKPVNKSSHNSLVELI